MSIEQIGYPKGDESLDTILNVLDYFDEQYEADPLDSAQVTAWRDALIKKVDGIKYLVENLEDQKRRLTERGDAFYKDAERMEKTIRHIQERARYVMEQKGFEKVPGTDWLMEIDGNPQHMSTMVVGRSQPSFEDMEKFPGYIRSKEVPQKIVHEWDMKAIKEAVLDGNCPIPGAKVTKKIIFKPRV